MTLYSVSFEQKTSRHYTISSVTAGFLLNYLLFLSKNVLVYKRNCAIDDVALAY